MNFEIRERKIDQETPAKSIILTEKLWKKLKHVSDVAGAFFPDRSIDRNEAGPLAELLRREAGKVVSDDGDKVATEAFVKFLETYGVARGLLVECVLRTPGDVAAPIASPRRASLLDERNAVPSQYDMFRMKKS